MLVNPEWERETRMCLSSQRRASAIGKFLVLKLRLTGPNLKAFEIAHKHQNLTKIQFRYISVFLNLRLVYHKSELGKISWSWEKWSCEYLQCKSLNFAFPPFLFSLPILRTPSFFLSFLLSKVLHTELQKSGYSHSESGTSPATTDLIIYLPSHQASFTQISPH